MFMYEHNNKWSQKQEANCKNFHDDQRNIPSTNKIFLYEDSFFSLIHWHSSMKFIMVCFILQANALYSHKPITISLLRKSCENITPQMDNTMLKKKKRRVVEGSQHALYFFIICTILLTSLCYMLNHHRIVCVEYNDTNNKTPC